MIKLKNPKKIQKSQHLKNDEEKRQNLIYVSKIFKDKQSGFKKIGF